METKHTLGPWSVDRFGLHVMAGERLVAGCGGHQDNFTPDLPEINRANARRIVACVNAGEGLSTEALEIYGAHDLPDCDLIDALREENLRLREALSAMIAAHGGDEEWWSTEGETRYQNQIDNLNLPCPTADVIRQQITEEARAALAKVSP